MHLRTISRFALTAAFFFSFPGLAPGQEHPCPTNRFHRVTDDFYFTASSDQGARGDVVAVDLFLTSVSPRQDLFHIGLAACYDATKAELLPSAAYTPAFDALAFRSSFLPLEQAGQGGFRLTLAVHPDRVAGLLPTPGPLHLATVFFRLLGSPGQSFRVEFCDNLFRSGDGPQFACYNNVMAYVPRRPDAAEEQVHALSTLHQPGEIRILDGPPTHPDPPSLPPVARVYPERPTADSAAIHFDLSGAVVRPGTREVPLELHATSNFEFSGFYLSVVFPAEHLELARVAEHTRPGAVRIDNEGGHVAMGMTNSARRLGAEGERVHLFTLYFNVKDGASGELRAAFEERGAFFNWLAIHYTDGEPTPERLPVTAEVEPLVVSAALLQVQREATLLGDVTLDYQVDLSDPVAVLEELFLGGEAIVCPPAADFNRDGRLNISDPISILQHLFLGGPPETLPRDVFCDG
jgi:hypothetical protein